MGSKSVERSRTPQPTFRRRGDFSPVSTLAAGGFMSEMHEATPVSQPFPHFERLVDSREAAALLQIHPKTLQGWRPRRDLNPCYRRESRPRVRNRLKLNGTDSPLGHLSDCGDGLSDC